MLLSAVFVFVVAQSSSEIPEGLMNNPVFLLLFTALILALTSPKSPGRGSVSRKKAYKIENFKPNSG